MLWNGFSALAHTLVVGVASYAVLVVVLRISGKRTLAKLNAFDLVVTVAVGSTLSSALIANDVALAQAVLALGLLVGLQFAVTRATMAVTAARRLVTARPTALVVDGRRRPEAMRRERISDDAIRSSLRQAGIADLAGAAAVVLESDGSLSVVPVGAEGRWALEGVEGIGA